MNKKNYSEQELDKELKKIQIKTFAKVAPIILVFGPLQVLLKSSDNIKIIKDKDNSREKDYQKLTLSSDLTEKLKKNCKEEKQILEDDKDSLEEQIDKRRKEDVSYYVEEVVQEEIPIPTTFWKSTSDEENNEVEKVSTKDEKQEEKHLGEISSLIENEKKKKALEQLENKKIVELYNDQLKEVRRELRQVIFEYNVLKEESEEIYEEKEIEEILKKLNKIIEKIEELYQRIKVEDLTRKDSPLLYQMVSEYMDLFKDQKIVNEIKDSPLYIAISEKLSEVMEKEALLEERVLARKEQLAIDEDKLNKMKEAYVSFDSLSNQLLQFQNEQEKILQQTELRIANAVTESEKVETKIVGYQLQTEHLLAYLAAQAAIPGVRGAKSIATFALVSLYLMRNLFRPNVRTKKYKVIKVTDYTQSIESSIKDIEKTAELMKKSGDMLDETIRTFEKEFAQYLHVVPEFDQMLEKLEQVKKILQEKSYDVDKIKEEQMNNLSKNKEQARTLEKVIEI